MVLILYICQLSNLTSLTRTQIKEIQANTFLSKEKWIKLNYFSSWFLLICQNSSTNSCATGICNIYRVDKERFSFVPTWEISCYFPSHCILVWHLALFCKEDFYANEHFAQGYKSAPNGKEVKVHLYWSKKTLANYPFI